MCVQSIVGLGHGTLTSLTQIPSLDTVAGQRIELSFAQNFWTSVSFITVLAALFLWFLVYVYAKAIIAAA